MATGHRVSLLPAIHIPGKLDRTGKDLFPCYISTCIVLLILLIGPENLMYLISGPIKLLTLDLAHRRD